MSIKYGDFFIEVLIKDGLQHLKWRLVVIYASTDEGKRAQQFEVLLTRITGYIEPCLLMGNFNDLLLESEKEGVMEEQLQVCGLSERLWLK